MKQLFVYFTRRYKCELQLILSLNPVVSVINQTINKYNNLLSLIQEQLLITSLSAISKIVAHSVLQSAPRLNVIALDSFHYNFFLG